MIKLLLTILLLPGILTAEPACKDIARGLTVEVRSNMPIILRAGQSYKFQATYTVTDRSYLHDIEKLIVWTTMRNSIQGSRSLNFTPDISDSFLNLEDNENVVAEKTLDVPGNFLGPYSIFAVLYAKLKSGAMCLDSLPLVNPVVHTVGNYAADSDIWPPKYVAAMANKKTVSPGESFKVFFAMDDQSDICTSALASQGKCNITPHAAFVFEDGTEIDDYQDTVELKPQRYAIDFKVPEDAKTGKITLKTLNVYDIYGNTVSAYDANTVTLEIKK